MLRGWLFLRSVGVGFALWALYTGLEPGDGWVGLPVAFGFALLVAWRRTGPWWLRVWPLPGFALYFLAQSLATGLHVARLALSPRSAWQPGWLELPSRLPEGPPRALFANLVSLLPGTLCGDLDRHGVHHIHLLQTQRDPEPSLRALERRVGCLYGCVPRKGGAS